MGDPHQLIAANSETRIAVSGSCEAGEHARGVGGPSRRAAEQLSVNLPALAKSVRLVAAALFSLQHCFRSSILLAAGKGGSRYHSNHERGLGHWIC